MKSFTMLALISACALTSVVGAAEPDAQALAAKAEDLLKIHCYRCHGQDGTNEGGLNYVLDVRRLIDRKKIISGDPAKSKLFRRLTSTDDPMPPADEKTRPGAEDVALLQKWIEAGAPDVQQAPRPRKFVAAEAITQALHNDLTHNVAERDRRFVRYFTLTHLFNAGLAEEELQSFRHGLSKLINSLSWGSRVVVPKAVDAERTIFRIDLRDYQWNERVWDAVLAVNPYGVGLATDAAKGNVEMTRCRLPYVRGDWFVAAAAKPPLYHDVLQLPRTEAELQKMLRIDTAENIRLERVARAGFNSSGVSRNNRLIERHEAGSVVYWKSYDFASNTGRQNLFAHPMGPGGGSSGFQHDGGEIIFNLPNGLQGYYLTDAEGRRLDKGPTAIVSDPKRPDRAVENGLSCMSCHARGLIMKADQVRDHVQKNPTAVAKQDIETILTLYPPRDKFTELLKADARRFQEAVAKTGAPLSATEPVAALALRFEAELDLPLAAAEVGVAPDKLLKVLDESPRLAQHLGPLRIEGGTVQRQVFVDVFGDVVRELRLGEFLEPRQKAVARCIMEGDGLLKKGDVTGAIRTYSEAITLDPSASLAFNNRGLAHARSGQLDRALADYTEAIRLDPDFAVAFHNRGALRHTMGELEKAITDYSEALRLDPKSALVHNNRGFAHFGRMDYDKAIADFDRAQKLDPAFVTAFNNRGLAHGRKGDHDRAIADYTEAIRLDPKFAKAYFNRAVAHEKKGDRVRSEADRKKAIELDPTLDKD